MDAELKDMTWLDQSRECIAKLDATLPADMPFADRQKAVRAAYPFWPRAHHPYKEWCKAQRAYLARFKKSDSAIPDAYLSPLERLMKRAKT